MILPDLSGNTNTELDDMDDGDDEEQDEEDGIPSRSMRKKDPDGKLKPGQDLVNNVRGFTSSINPPSHLFFLQMDYGSGHRLTIPQSLFMHGLAPPSGGGGSTLPISSMRDPNVNNKRPRIGVIVVLHLIISDGLVGPYSYHPSQNLTPFNRPSNSLY